MIKLYPDTLSYWIEDDSTRNAQGRYTSVGGSYTEIGKCRLEFNSPGSAPSGNDRRVLSTGAVIYAPLTTASLPEPGQKVKVVRSVAGTVSELNVVNAERGLLHVRIWAE